MHKIQSFNGFINEKKKLKFHKLRDESINPELAIEEFAEKRGEGAQSTVDSSKEKGGLSMLSHDHFKVKIPYYDKAASGKFNVGEFKKEYQDLLSELIESTLDEFDISQKDFQEIVGKLEVLGELCIRNNDTSDDSLSEAKKN